MPSASKVSSLVPSTEVTVGAGTAMWNQIKTAIATTLLTMGA